MNYCFALPDVPLIHFSKDVLGGKGHGLAQMKREGYPVPPAYIITTEACREYFNDPLGVMNHVHEVIIPQIIKGLTAEFGYMPLVSVRSGAKFSMPGMMDTILNVGLDRKNEAEWAERVGVECVEDSRKRLIEMFGNVVHGIARDLFEGKSLPEREKQFKDSTSFEFPDAVEQLYSAIEAVFKSWNNDRAQSYRRMNGIPNDLGTAVVVQAMVFGNMNDKSCTGVLFTRDPSDGTKEIVGEFLINAQGEDVVAGIRTPQSLDKLPEWNEGVAVKLHSLALKLESEACDAQDIEFTVQDGTLFILQTRSAKRTAQAAIKIAVDMLEEGLITPEDAMQRVSHKQFAAATRPMIDPEWKKANPAHGKGIPASNGVAIGRAVFSSAAALKFKGECILIAEETTPDDIEGMNAALGILTRTGGNTSHAAVVARGMDKVCVVGCGELKFMPTQDCWMLKQPKEDDGFTVHYAIEGATVAIDGQTGEIWLNKKPVVINGAEKPEVKTFLSVVKNGYEIYEVVTAPEQMHGKENAVLLAAQVRSADKLKACIDAFNGSELVIDTRAKWLLCEDEDFKFMMALGSEGLAIEQARLADTVLKLLKAYSGDRSKIMVLGFTAELPDGYKVVPVVDSIDLLLDVDGLCLLSRDKLIASAGSAERVKKIVAIRRRAGDDLRSLNIFNELVEPEVFKRGSAVAVSERVLLASVLAS